MKELFATYFNRKGNLGPQSLVHYARNGVSRSYLMIFFLTILLSGCSKQQPEIKVQEPIVEEDIPTLNSDDEFRNAYQKSIQSSDNEVSASHGFSLITFLNFCVHVQRRLNIAN